MKPNARKAVFAVFLNIFLVFLALYIFDLLNVVTFRQIIESVGLGRDELPKIEDPFLLEREELKKRWQLVELKQRENLQARNTLEQKNQELEDREAQLLAIEQQLQARETQFEQQQIAQMDNAERIRAVANQLMNMEPQSAVDRLEQQPDDLFVIELLQSIDQQSEELGRMSVVPFLLSLMDSERAAVIQRKMANIPGD